MATKTVEAHRTAKGLPALVRAANLARKRPPELLRQAAEETARGAP
jgi:hypothetical protein